MRMHICIHIYIYVHICVYMYLHIQDLCKAHAAVYVGLAQVSVASSDRLLRQALHELPVACLEVCVEAAMLRGGAGGAGGLIRLYGLHVRRA